MNEQKRHEDDSSSTDCDEDVADSAAAACSRPRRDVLWCAVDMQQNSHTSNVAWPPNPASIDTYDWRNLRHVNFGNPILGTKMQLFSRTNYNLAIYADNAVRGTMDDNDLHTHLELITAGHPGHVRIQGMLTKLYVAMDSKGRLYGEPDMTEEGTVFVEAFQGSYNTYLSRKYAHLGWYLGIKKSGNYKKGCKTSYRQKAVQFLPRRSKFE